jgi:glutathione S-transferase
VQIFLAEAGLEDTVALYKVDLPGREHDKKEYKKLNPVGRIPVLEVPGARPIAESLAICRYLEATYAPKGQSSLFGDTPYETATIEMWDRRFDMNLLVQGLGRVWYGGNPLKAQEAAAIGMRQTKNNVTYGQGVAISMLKLAEYELRSAGSPFIAGPRFTSADISLLCCLDFGLGLAGLEYDASKFPSLEAWRERVASRPSVKKYPNPYVGPMFAGIHAMIAKHHDSLPE